MAEEEFMLPEYHRRYPPEYFIDFKGDKKKVFGWRHLQELQKEDREYRRIRDMRHELGD